MDEGLGDGEMEGLHHGKTHAPCCYILIKHSAVVLVINHDMVMKQFVNCEGSSISDLPDEV